MRKVVAISLLLLVFIGQVGYYFFYTIERSAVRSEMDKELETKISKNVLQVIVLEENPVIWEEQGKEFYLDGILYDVAAIEKQNGKTLMHCFADKKELELTTDAAKAIASSHDKTAGGKESKHSIKFQLTYYLFDTMGRLAYSTIIPSLEYFDFDVTIYPSFYAVDTDPPRA